MTEPIRNARCLIGPALIPLILGLATVGKVHAQIELIEKLRPAGDPVTLADLEPKDLKPADNAATYLGRISKEADQLYDELQPHAHADHFSWRVGLTADQSRRAAAAFDAHPEVFTTLERAAKLSRHAWPHDYSLSPEKLVTSMNETISHTRMFARLHDARARYLCSIGKHDEAAKVGIQLLRLVRLQDQEPLLAPFLVNQACRAISLNVLNGVLHTGELEPATHKAMEEELAKHDSMDCLIHAIKTDRAYGLDSMRRQLIGALTGPSYLKAIERQIAMGTKSHYELAAKGGEEEEAPPFAKLIEPALDACREAMNRTRARTRCLRVLNAIHAQARDAENVYIDALGLPEEITIDPYTGKPLIVKSTPIGWLVYSVGKNQKDDGGKLSDLSDFGVGPPELTE